MYHYINTTTVVVLLLAVQYSGADFVHIDRSIFFPIFFCLFPDYYYPAVCGVTDIHLTARLFLLSCLLSVELGHES